MGDPIEEAIVLCAFYHVSTLSMSCFVGAIPCSVDLANGTCVPPEKSHVGIKLPSHPFNM